MYNGAKSGLKRKSSGMATQETNEKLTQVGPGTLMGEYLRRYWHPIGAVTELEKEPVMPVRLLGENLVLFKTEKGEYGLVAERCAHRGISMAYGIPQENGLRCAYHGWTYNTAGQVVDMPFEPICLSFKITAYPVQEMGGMIWAYMGPSPAPLLPRFDRYVRDDMRREIEFIPLPCNWVQCMDNSLDPVHFEHLHGVYGNYVNERLGKPPAMTVARHLKIDFDVFEYGIVKRRLLEGEPEDCDDWTTGHPVLFPYTLLVGDRNGANYQIRVPVDDTHTLHIRYQTYPLKDGEPQQTEIPFKRTILFNGDGSMIGPASAVPKQDMLAWVAQGPISDRTTEHLVTSDKGVILYHRMLLEEAEKVARGEDPIGTVRDLEVNEPMISIKIESVARAPFRRLAGTVAQS
jgi:5,5'-dehydrodivanillate O-demethylase oxygenase subunit